MALFKSITTLLLIIAVFRLTESQTTLAPSPAADSCNGIFLSYTHIKTTKLVPDLIKTAPTKQPYRFDAKLAILNNGLEDLKSWKVFVGFLSNELLVSATNAILVDGSSFPARVGNGTVFSGFPVTDLKTAFETAGDLTQMMVEMDLVGTQFGVAPPNVPMPSNVTLANDGFICPNPTKIGKTELQVCCTKDANFISNITLGDEFLPRQDGDLTILYDVTKTYDTNYWVQVTIDNHNPLGRLDNWKLSWDWMRDEFIFAMRGAYPSVVDTTDCIYGRQGQFYAGLDFSTALNCERRPTIVDLPPTKANDSQLGFVPFCCRNGTILPPLMDPSRSSSAFQMNVFKMPPDVNRSQITPPQNWRINGTLNPDYQCGPPVRVSPTQFPNPSGLSDTSAVASWQVVCNITQAKGTSPRCCVSFSSYYNDSVIPCNTCACGCSSNTANSCSTTSPAILLPPEALLVPFDNRTALAVAYSNLKRRAISNPMPCGDNCGVSLNWHINADYSSGWTARVTVFNWEETNFVDWFVAVQMDKAGPGFEKAYSFNGSALDGVNNTIFMQGLPGLNYLVAETDATNPKKNPRIPGKQQSVLSFTKKLTPGIKVSAGDGFPTKVFFNGEECSLPTVFPSSSGKRESFTIICTILLSVLAFLMMDR